MRRIVRAACRSPSCAHSRHRAGLAVLRGHDRDSYGVGCIPDVVAHCSRSLRRAAGLGPRLAERAGGVLLRSIHASNQRATDYETRRVGLGDHRLLRASDTGAGWMANRPQGVGGGRTHRSADARAVDQDRGAATDVLNRESSSTVPRPRFGTRRCRRSALGGGLRHGGQRGGHSVTPLLSAIGDPGARAGAGRFARAGAPHRADDVSGAN
jgi:hypothetical protein